MKKEWRLIGKILEGRKTVESRWYRNRSAPWGRIKKGEAVYFKETGCPVSAKAQVSEVEQFENLTQTKIKQIFEKYPLAKLGAEEIKSELSEHIKGKKYCIMISLEDPQKVPPFDLDKKGFGLMSAWICVEDIKMLYNTAG